MRQELSEQLRTTDPVAHESGLSDTEVAVMRRAIIAAAGESRRVEWWPRPAPLMAALALALVVGVFIRPLFESVREPIIRPQVDEHRLLQFETPGGTRVVWVLNSEFDLPKDRQP